MYSITLVDTTDTNDSKQLTFNFSLKDHLQFTTPQTHKTWHNFILSQACKAVQPMPFQN